MAIPVEEATLGAKLEFIDTLNNHLKPELNALESTEFPLPEPEHYIESDLQQEWEKPFRRHPVEEVAGVVHPWTPTDNVQEYTGDSTEYERTQDVTFVTQIVFRWPGGFDHMPQVRGRQMDRDEWMQRRAEKYKGALIRAVSKEAQNGEEIHELTLTAHDAEATPPNDLGPIYLASVLWDVTQDVLVPLS